METNGKHRYDFVSEKYDGGEVSRLHNRSIPNLPAKTGNALSLCVIRYQSFAEDAVALEQ